ncbi:MAG: substrate-binding domain-containing protein, partial [Demequina sp.]|uniref:substrate-binding domain-containing protein n=1 Tax=Demequina sp. TaxID=2050685 RepID=UPI003A8607DF
KVMGFDGVLEGQLSVPSLSTIDLGVSALAASAVGMLMQRIENPDDPTPGRREVAEFTLVERESTAPSAASAP